MARIAMRKTEDPVAGNVRKKRRKSLQAAHYGAGFISTGHHSCGGLFATGAALTLVTETH